MCAVASLTVLLEPARPVVVLAIPARPALQLQRVPVIPVVPLAARPCRAHQLKWTALAAPVVIGAPWPYFASQFPGRGLLPFASFDPAQVFLLARLRRLYVQSVLQPGGVMQEDCAIAVVLGLLLVSSVLLRRVLELERFPHVSMIRLEWLVACLDILSGLRVVLTFRLTLLGDLDVLSFRQVLRR